MTQESQNFPACPCRFGSWRKAEALLSRYMHQIPITRAKPLLADRENAA
jgi:hypothetical protein